MNLAQGLSHSLLPSIKTGTASNSFKTLQTALSLDIAVVLKDYLTFLENDKSKYSLIFADPPYAFEFDTYKSLVGLAQEVFDKEGQLIIEHFNKIDLSSVEGFDYSRNYGSATFSFLKNKKMQACRILSSLIIYLDVRLLLHSSRLPVYIGRATLNCRTTWRCTA